MIRQRRIDARRDHELKAQHTRNKKGEKAGNLPHGQDQSSSKSSNSSSNSSSGSSSSSSSSSSSAMMKSDVSAWQQRVLHGRNKGLTNAATHPSSIHNRILSVIRKSTVAAERDLSSPSACAIDLTADDETAHVSNDVSSTNISEGDGSSSSSRSTSSCSGLLYAPFSKVYTVEELSSMHVPENALR